MVCKHVKPFNEAMIHLQPFWLKAMLMKIGNGAEF